MEENYVELKPKKFRFGQVGDYIKGTLIKIDKTTQPDQYGKLSDIYTILAHEGIFLGSTKNEKTGKFVDDKEQTTIEGGKNYTLFLSTDSVPSKKMQDLKIGQKFMAKFEETKNTGKGFDAKIIKIFAGTNKDGTPLLNQEWIDANKDSFKEF